MLIYRPFYFLASLTKICPNGDIILSVGPKAKIQVASDFLKHISPVFKAMLDAPMSEGEALRNKSPDSPIMISLPDDDPAAMKRLLRLLYGADDLDLSFGAFCDVATLADKYGMVERLKHFGASCLVVDPYDKDSDPDYDDCWDKLLMSHMLDNHAAFFRISAVLTKSREGMIYWGFSSPGQLLGLKLACKYTPCIFLAENNLWIVAIEELRRVRPNRRSEVGLCLYCFKKVKSGFAFEQAGCKFKQYHWN
jgi:hypothetical protein